MRPARASHRDAAIVYTPRSALLSGLNRSAPEAVRRHLRYGAMGEYRQLFCRSAAPSAPVASLDTLGWGRDYRARHLHTSHSALIFCTSGKE